MDAKITRIELLLDKLNLLFAQVMEDGHLDRIEQELMLKYSRQLAELLDSQSAVIVPELTKKEQPKQDIVREPLMDEPEKNAPVLIHTEVPVADPSGNDIIAPESIVTSATEKIDPIKEIKTELPEVKDETPVKKIMPELAADKKIPDPTHTRKPLVKSDEEDSDEESFNTGINSKLSGAVNKKTLADKIIAHKAKDLKSVIDLNERILLTKGLFANDKDAYEAAIKTLNSMTSFQDAEQFIMQKLKPQYGWKDSDAVDHLIDVVRLKFS